MTDAPLVGDFLNVGPYAVPSAKDALNKYEFVEGGRELRRFSGPSMRIGIDFADVDAAESILPTGQSGNVFIRFTTTKRTSTMPVNSASSAWIERTLRPTNRGLGLSGSQ